MTRQQEAQKKERDSDKQEIIKEAIDMLGRAVKELKSDKIWDAKFSTEEAFHMLHELVIFYDDEEELSKATKCSKCGRVIS